MATVGVIIHHLEMLSRDQLKLPSRPAPSFRLVRAEIPCPELNRFLYTTVGERWHWTDRLPWTLAQWKTYVDRQELETWVAHVRGTPAGYFELEMQPGQNVELVYFGLLPQFQGQGLGAALLTKAVERAWDMGASRVWVHTCTHDHPAALTNYQARGFREFKRTTAEQTPVGPMNANG